MNGTKPEYKVPSMFDIQQIPLNGYNVVSTFSGGGGSCLGYRMAGFNVLWANEFVEEAQKTYRMNHPDVILDTRDIRTVTADEILAVLGRSRGDIDIFDGSPPCCAFSTAGKREKNWGSERAYSDGKSQQVENLFFEYIRILNGLQPKVFIAENVSGLVKGTAIGYFKEFMHEMKKCGYRVKAQLLNAKYLGVPQSRERLIFIGVRNDLNMDPVFPKPFKYVYSLGDALKTVKNDHEEVDRLLKDADRYAWGQVLKRIPKNPKHFISGQDVTNGVSYFSLRRESMYEPCTTICQSNGVRSGNSHPLQDRKFTIAELKRITAVPDDFIVTGNYAQQWERLGRMVPPVMMMHIADTVRKEVLDKCRTM